MKFFKLFPLFAFALSISLSSCDIPSVCPEPIGLSLHWQGELTCNGKSTKTTIFGRTSTINYQIANAVITTPTVLEWDSYKVLLYKIDNQGTPILIKSTPNWIQMPTLGIKEWHSVSEQLYQGNTPNLSSTLASHPNGKFKLVVKVTTNNQACTHEAYVNFTYNSDRDWAYPTCLEPIPSGTVDH